MQITKRELHLLIREAVETQEIINDKAEDLHAGAQKQGTSINMSDANALITALVGTAGGAASIMQLGKPIALAIDVSLGLKFLYDAMQTINAQSSLADILEPYVGPRLGFVPGIRPLTMEDVEKIRRMPAQEKQKARQYAVSFFQYYRRAIISGLGMIPSITGVSDLALGGISVAISTGPLAEAIIAILKAQANIIKLFKPIVAAAQKDSFVGKSLRLLVNPGGTTDIGMILIALDILEPGAGDKLTQYVNPTGATRGETAREVGRAAHREAQAQRDYEEEVGIERKTQQPKLDMDMSVYSQGPYVPDEDSEEDDLLSDPITVPFKRRQNTPEEDLRLVAEGKSYSTNRWQKLAGIN